MLITKIEQQKKDPSRVSVFIDGEFAFGLKYEDAYLYRLNEGDELTRADYERIVTETVLTSARDMAVKYLGYRMRSRREIEKYLKQKEFTDEVIEKTIETLKTYNYINDLEFAKAYISDSLRFNKWGMKKIKYELTKRGVAREVIDEAAESAEYSTEKILAGLIEKKLNGNILNEADYNEKRKLFNYLMNRGFSYDEINAAYAEYIESGDE